MDIHAKLNDLIQEEQRLAQEARDATERWNAAKMRLSAVEKALGTMPSEPEPPLEPEAIRHNGDTSRVRNLIYNRARWSRPVRTVTTKYVAKQLRLSHDAVQKILSYLTRAGGLQRTGVGCYRLINEELLNSRPPGMK